MFDLPEKYLYLPTDKKTIEKLLTSNANSAYIKPEKGKKKTVRFPLRPTSLQALLFKLDGDRIGDFKLYFKQQT